MDSGLYKAVSSGDYKSFLSLINANHCLLQQTTHTQKNTVLHVAAEFNQKKIAEEILTRQRSLLCITNAKEDTVLHYAARFGSYEVAEFLINSAKLHRLEEGKSLLTMVNDERDSALHDAVKNDHYDVVELLMKEDPSLADNTNRVGESPLFTAVERGFFKIAGEILQKKSNCSYEGREGANVLHAMIIRTQKPYTKNLIQTPIRVYLAFPLMYFNLFLPRFFQLPYWEWKGISNLSYTQREFLNELLRKFPHILREKDKYGWLPLHYAAKLGNDEFVELILQKEPSLAYAKENKGGMSSIHIAAKDGRLSVIKTLMKYCPDICELLGPGKKTALHFAAISSQPYTIKKMVEIPSFLKIVNEQDEDGNTALHLSAMSGNFVILMMLAANGKVDNKITNKKELTTNDIIRLNTTFGWYEKSIIIALLEHDGALRGMQEVMNRENTSENEKKEKTESEEEEKNKQKNSNEESDDTTSNDVHKKLVKEKEKGAENIWKNVYDSNLVVATIIATVTFSATFQVPGGYSGKDGLAVLRQNRDFKSFVIADSLSFGYAAASIFVTFFTGLFGTNSGFSYPRKWVTFLTGTSLWFMVFSFMFGTSAVLGEDSGFARAVRAVACFSFIWPVFLLGAVAVNWFAYFP